jgi:hypothetical protein
VESGQGPRSVNLLKLTGQRAAGPVGRGPLAVNRGPWSGLRAQLAVIRGPWFGMRAQLAINRGPWFAQLACVASAQRKGHGSRAMVRGPSCMVHGSRAVGYVSAHSSREGVESRHRFMRYLVIVSTHPLKRPPALADECLGPISHKQLPFG